MGKFISRFLSLLIATVFITGSFTAAYADDGMFLTGKVKDALTKIDLPQAKLILFDSNGTPIDTTTANMGRRWRGEGMIDTLSVFYFDVPKKISDYKIDVICPGYNTLTVPFSVDKLGRYVEKNTVPTIYLTRAPRQLKEVTVVASKIKFYNKGDTIVYNADAFQLAEGSMLDALISQLPGAELNEDGQIKINGEFVESLLLNGKQFFDGNNNIMLENIGTYTVKDIQVYEAQKIEDQQRSDRTAPKVLTMDVRLKKEYNAGLILNAQGGAGTEGRYLGNLFASWFSPTTHLSLVSNVNNLNDNRKPGRNDTWTPEKMPSGSKSRAMAGVNYNYSDLDDKCDVTLNARFEQSIDNTVATTARTNFLPGGDTYDHSISRSRNREVSAFTCGNMFLHNDNGALGLNYDLNYRYRKNADSGLSASFNKDQEGTTDEILDAIYSDGSPDKLDALLNRSKTRSNSWSRSWNGSVQPFVRISVPGRDYDNIHLYFMADYSSTKEELWRDYDVSYGANAGIAPQKLRQYTDNSPNHLMTLGGGFGYSTIIKHVDLMLYYRFSYNENVEDSYMYALDRLEDMGIYGVLPADYVSALDPANSFSSVMKMYSHAIQIHMGYHKRFDNSGIFFDLSPQISIVKRHLDYMRNNQDYSLTTYDTYLRINNKWDGRIEYMFGELANGDRGSRYRNSIVYSMCLLPTMPTMTDMIDVVNDANPLNIYVGNPYLKNETVYRNNIEWKYKSDSYPFNNRLGMGYSFTTNAIKQGYTYDTNTGVRVNKKYNVKGGNSSIISDELLWQFGSKKQFSLSSESNVTFSTYTDMIGVNNTEPSFSKVNYRSLSEKINLSWQIRKQSISLRCDAVNRRTTSKAEGFAPLNANHFNYGVSGVFNLPAGFGISSDFTCYTRRGYGSSNLDTTDPIWNMRLSYCPSRHSRLVVMLDGYDLLHKLSNVNYAVTASGRTVTYTNVLPRYIMLSVQYRLNIQPKKRILPAF